MLHVCSFQDSLVTDVNTAAIHIDARQPVLYAYSRTTIPLDGWPVFDELLSNVGAEIQAAFFSDECQLSSDCRRLSIRSSTLQGGASVQGG